MNEKGIGALDNLIKARKNAAFIAAMRERFPGVDVCLALDTAAELRAEHEAIQVGRSKGNKRLKATSPQIIRATEYLDAMLWVKDLKESYNYLAWLEEKYPDEKPISESTAREHLKRARMFHSEMSKRPSP